MGSGPRLITTLLNDNDDLLLLLTFKIYSLFDLLETNRLYTLRWHIMKVWMCSLVYL